VLLVIVYSHTKHNSKISKYKTLTKSKPSTKSTTNLHNPTQTTHLLLRNNPTATTRTIDNGEKI
jgi:hypothetical protein